MLREPVVAGRFYPGEAQALRRTVQGLLSIRQDAGPALGVIAPHAGYVYSGAIAGQTLGRVRIPPTLLCLGPNHHGGGHRAAVYGQGSWRSPLGDVAIAEDLAAALLAEVPGLAGDPRAHVPEHSLEVLIPFLQVLAPASRIVPVCFGHNPLEMLLSLGKGIARVLQRQAEPVLMLCSSDMTHYESGEAAARKDRLALERIQALDPEGLYRTVVQGRISMCGLMPAVVMLAAARELGAHEADLVAYGNSGDVTGDQSSVVGYAGVVIR